MCIRSFLIWLKRITLWNNCYRCCCRCRKDVIYGEVIGRNEDTLFSRAFTALLDKFYYDRKRYSFPLQIYFLNRRFEMLKKASEAGEPRLMDRSIYGDMIFAKLLYGEAYMEQKKKLIIKNVGTCIFGRLLNNSSVI